MPLRNIIIIAIAAIFSLMCHLVAAKNRFAMRFAEALEIVETNALLPVVQPVLFDAAMTGMMSSLDEHSEYLYSKGFVAFEEDLRQEFAGVGMDVAVAPTTKSLVVLAPMPDSPAMRAGLVPGDRIVRIDGNSAEGLSRNEAIERIRGPVGTPVVIDVDRSGEELSFSIVRQAIQVKSVMGDWMEGGQWRFTLEQAPEIGYIRLTQFGDQSVEEFRNAVAAVNGKVSALIIDLRNNSGGLLSAAVEICDMFLPAEQLIVETRARGGKSVQSYRSSREVMLPLNVPLVVLINRNSASASEIVAACLQDHQRAVVIGERSWGKGTVQNILPLEANRSALRLTTGNYFRPSGKNIDRNVAKRLDPNSEDWGVKPEGSFAIAQTEESIFEDYLRRRVRDLEWLTRPFNGQANVDLPLMTAEKISELLAVPQSEGEYHDLSLEAAIEYIKAQLLKTVSG
jgi:carboxyl-terminal processing protease